MLLPNKHMTSIQRCLSVLNRKEGFLRSNDIVFTVSMEFLYIMIELFAENHSKRPTHCEAMPAESKIAHFAHSKKLHRYKQKYNHQCYIYIPQIGHNATFYFKVKLHKQYFE